MLTKLGNARLGSLLAANMQSRLVASLPTALRAYSTSTDQVKITEQKVKVGKYEINYVRSTIESGNQKKTLVCLPGALGKLF